MFESWRWRFLSGESAAASSGSNLSDFWKAVGEVRSVVSCDLLYDSFQIGFCLEVC